MSQSAVTHFFIIVNYNAGADLLTCVRSLLASNHIVPHIVIVDNASTDTSLHDCRADFPSLYYLTNTRNRGFGAAANQGMRFACTHGATTITLCNPDAVVDPDCMHRIFSAMRDHAIHIASPVIYSDAAKTHIWFAGGTIRWWRMRAVHTPRTTLSTAIITATDYVTGCVMTVDRRVCDTVGLFDERFFLYYEDADLSVRTRRAGFTLGIVTHAHAVHAEVSECAQEQKTYFLVLSGLLFFHTHLRGVKKAYFYLLFALRYCKNIIDRRRNKPLSGAVFRAFRAYVSRNI